MGNFSQILSVASMGRGKGCIRFCGRSDQNCGYHGNRKLPLTYNGQNGVSAFSQSALIGSLSNLQVTRTGIKSQMSSTLGQVRLFTTELFALERSNGENGVSIVSQSLWIQSSSNLQVMRTGIKSRTSLNFGRIWPVILALHALECWKNVSSFSQSPLIVSLSNLQVTRTGIKAWTSWNLDRIGLFILELFALECRNVFP